MTLRNIKRSNSQGVALRNINNQTIKVRHEKLGKFRQSRCDSENLRKDK